MAFRSDYDPSTYKSWELNPSTRESMMLFTKAYPVDKTLTTAGTAENIILVDKSSMATVNMITNPSCETMTSPATIPDGFTARRSTTLTQNGTYYDSTNVKGIYSLGVAVTGSHLIGEGAYWDLGAYPKDIPLALSAYARRGGSGTPKVRIELIAATTGITDVTNVRVAVGEEKTLSGSFQRLSLVSGVNRFTKILYITGASGTFSEDETITGGTSGATAIISTVGTGWIAIRGGNGIQFKCESSFPGIEVITGSSTSYTATLTSSIISVLNNVNLYFAVVLSATLNGVNFYVDGWQAEALSQATTYCDGAQGYLHWWDGTANASTSRRWRKLSSIRSYRLHCTKDIYLGFNQDAAHAGTNAEDRGEYIPANTDFGEDHPIHLDTKISFVNAVDTEQPRVYGVIWGI